MHTALGSVTVALAGERYRPPPYGKSPICSIPSMKYLHCCHLSSYYSILSVYRMHISNCTIDTGQLLEARYSFLHYSMLKLS